MSKKTDIAAETELSSEEILKKYDSESNTRPYTGLIQIIVTVLLAVFSVYAVYTNIFALWDTHIKKALFIAWMLFLTFLLYPLSKKHNTLGKTAFSKVSLIVDGLLAICGCGAFLYFAINYRAIANTAGRINTMQIVIGIVGILVLMECCRRVSGIPILVVAGAFLIYALFFSGVTLRDLVYTLFYTDNGVIGTPTSVCSTYIVIFVLFGSFLETTGISEFFIRVANAIAGASSGGPAKVAVISSALCGMVSGSSVANTVTTGSVTIPLMKRTGYQPEFAGAVEAAASTGGQIMPPIMGAAAFLMAEYIGTSYVEVAVKAILPALLYFTGIFIMVHLEAKKLGLKGLSKEELPKLLPLILKEGFLLLPLVVLMYLVIATQAMALSAFFAIMAAIAVASFVKSKNALFLGIKLALAIIPTVLAILFGIKDTLAITVALAAALILVAISTYEKNDRCSFRAFSASLAAGAKSTLSVALACGIAGIIAGVVTKTGIGNIIISGILTVAGGQKLIALFLTMICCIVLGMGVPTTANFIIMASTCAPILIELGINRFSAFMFVFYFGIVADITPPVALAAYAGSAIAKASPLKTGVNASKLAIGAFIIPYIFALNPAMLFIDTTWYEVILIVLTSVLGMYGVAMGLEGYTFGKLHPLLRAVVIAAGLLLIYPGVLTDVIGFAIIAAVVLFQRLVVSKKQVGAAA